MIGLVRIHACGPRDRLPALSHGVNQSAFDARVVTGPTRSFEFSIRIFTSLHRINLELTQHIAQTTVG